ncbi:MAG: tetratricopeptide repeat protein [Bacteroidales bacterium]|nr:tetratricopeptide repeat protein [Bacteroidales bacterium]
MKRLMYLISMLVVAGYAFGQDVNVVSAFKYYNDQYPDLAKQAIDKAIQNEGSAKEARTWFYRGNIYLQVNSVAHMTDFLKKGLDKEAVKQRLGEPSGGIRNYKKLEDGEKWSYSFELVIYFSKGLVDSWDYPNEALYRSLDDGKTLDVAYEAYQKSLAIDPEYKNFNISPMNAMMGLEAVAGSYFNAGVSAYTAENYKESMYNLERAVKVYDDLQKPNPELVYYTGVACLQTGDTAKAIDYYNRAIKMSYKDKLLYYNLVNIYLAQNNTEAAKKIIKIGREYHPADQDLLITEANIYLKTGEAGEAEAILLEAVKNDPTNANLYYVIGANYDNILNDTTSSTEAKDHAFEQAQVAYKKALELQPDYFDANFNIGVLLNNKAAEIFEYINNLSIDAEAEYNTGKEKATGYLKQAQPYLEKAYQINPKDRDTLILLKQVYLKTNNTEKFQEVNKLLNEL